MELKNIIVEGWGRHKGYRERMRSDLDTLSYTCLNTLR